jgi:hypothetical protein
MLVQSIFFSGRAAQARTMQMVPGEKYGAPRSIAHQNDRKTVIYTMRWYDSNHFWVLKELCVNLSLGCV